MAKKYNANQLNKFLSDLKKQTEKALADDVARSVYEIVQKYLLSEVYGKYKPSDYDRTYELLRSLKIAPVYNNGSMVSIKIYFPNEVFRDNKHKMRYGIEEMTLSRNDMPTITEVLDILQKGLNPYRPDADVMDKAIEELKTTGIILKKLIAYLKSRGYNIQ